MESESSAAGRHTEVMNHLNALGAQLGKIMTDIENLTTAVTALQAAVADAVADIEKELAIIAAGNTGNDPSVAQAVANITAAVDALKAEHAKIPASP